MQKLLFIAFAFLFWAETPAQSQSPAGAQTGRLYTQAIGDFIKAANKKNPQPFDTLYIGKRANGQPDDFPDITLPAKIEHTVIKLIDPATGTQLQQERKSRVYINLVGWTGGAEAEFIFVVFSNGFVHQYDYTLNYRYNTKTCKHVLEKLQFKGPPF